jgi:methylamine dehydrogenase accessory protein MauD
MTTVGWIAYSLLWLTVLFLGFLLLGTLRALARLRWRLEQLEQTTPRQRRRNGLPPGVKAPDFTLPATTGQEVSLHDFAGRPVLLVFTQVGCQPCHRIVPELNRLQQQGALQVVAVAHGEMHRVRQFADETAATFPVLTQPQWDVSKRYQVFATPFGFVLDARGVIRSKGLLTTRHYLRFLVSEAASRTVPAPTEPVVTGGETNPA